MCKLTVARVFFSFLQLTIVAFTMELQSSTPKQDSNSIAPEPDDYETETVYVRINLNLNILTNVVTSCTDRYRYNLFC